MPAEEIEDKPFNEGTLTKLELFELYARAWLPVFTSPGGPAAILDSPQQCLKSVLG